jgi:hypothetical protein
MLTTPPCGSVKGCQVRRREEDRGEVRENRAWVYIEMMCAVLTVTGVNQDLCDGRSKERLTQERERPDVGVH